MERATLCHIIKGDHLLLKKATRGISVGKWNAPGGKIEQGEEPEESAKREVLEETGLIIGNLFYHGIITYIMGSGKPKKVRVYLFSTREFRGEPRATDEGELRWFNAHNLPIEEMWDDDKFWLLLMLTGRKFNAIFYYDKKNERVRKCIINSR